MSRRLLRSRWFWCLLIVTVAFFTVWWSRRPIAILTLPDGTRIHLMKITVGTEHGYKLPVPPNSSAWEHLMRIFEKQKYIQTSTTQPVFHLRVAKGANCPQDVYMEAIVTKLSDGSSATNTHHSILFQNSKAGQLIRSKIGPQRAVSETLHFNSRGASVAVVAPHFDRRGKSIPLHVYWNGELHAWEWPNPLYGKTLPSWQPEPFPIRRTFGDYSVVSNGWVPDGDDRFGLETSIQFRGKEINDGLWRLWDGKYEDVTGQHSDQANLSRSETAWKSTSTFIVKSAALPDEGNRATFREVALPQPGSFRVLDVPADLSSRGVALMAVVGKGRFLIENSQRIDRPEDALLEFPANTFAASRATQRGWHLNLRSKEPAIVVVQTHDAEGTGWAMWTNPDVSLDGSPSLDLEAPEFFDEFVPPLTDPKQVQLVAVHPLRVADQGIGHPGTFNIRFTWPEVLHVEELIAPPPMPLK